MSNTEISETQAKTLEERLFSEVDAWLCEPGETLVGTVTEVGRFTSAYGSYPAITVRKDDGEELIFHGFRTVAKNELSRCRPVVGDTIGILYVGPVDGADYHGYRIKIDRTEPGSTIDWSEWDNDRKPSTPSEAGEA